MDSFERIIGYDDVKLELYQILDMIKKPEKYKKLGAKMPGGVLIYGEPGLGKTMLANAFIKESGLKAYTLRRSTHTYGFIKILTSTFEEAAKNAPAIILLDDMDKFANDDALHRDSEELVAVQTSIDEVKDKGVFIIATGNDLCCIPDSLLRKGRFDRIFHLELPEEESTEKIIELYLKDKNVDPNINVDDIFGMTHYSSCAELENIVNIAAMYAGYDDKERIDINDVVKAVLRNTYDISDTFTNCDGNTLKTYAIHEAGHAVVAEAIVKGSVGLISISGKGDYGGITHLRKRSKRSCHEIVIGLGGKVAGEMWEGETYIHGCEMDLARVHRLIERDVTKGATFGYDLIKHRDINMSNQSLYKIESIIASEMHRKELIVRDILHKNKDFLERIVDELIEKKTLISSDIQRIRESAIVTEVEL